MTHSLVVQCSTLALSVVLVNASVAAEIPKDDMVTIPSGPAVLGEKDERVHVDTFQIDRTEVTVLAYRRCVEVKKCNRPADYQNCAWNSSGHDNHPVDCVSWEDAQTFCAWAGKRLPTDVEWEKAARGTDGRRYPWGSSGFDGDGREAVANICDKNCENGLTTYDDGWEKTAPVGSFSTGKSPYGVVDMVGNVAEYVDGMRGTLEGSGAIIVEIRGTNWHDGLEDTNPSSRRGIAISLRSVGNGFRCAKSLENGAAAAQNDETLSKTFSLRVGTEIHLPGTGQDIGDVKIDGEDKSTFRSGQNIAIFVALGAEYNGRTARLTIKDLTDNELDETAPIGPIDASPGGGKAVQFNLRVKAEHPKKIRISLALDEMESEKIITVIPAD